MARKKLTVEISAKLWKKELNESGSDVDMDVVFLFSRTLVISINLV